MEQKPHKKHLFFSFLGLAAFAFIALASGSSKDVVNDRDFQEGFRAGWNATTSMTDSVSTPCNIDSIAVEMPLVADNN